MDHSALSSRASMFGMTPDIVGLLRMRLSEHAVHTWDVAVVLDAAARVDAHAVALLIDGVSPSIAWMNKSIAWMSKKAAAPRSSG